MEANHAPGEEDDDSLHPLWAAAIAGGALAAGAGAYLGARALAKRNAPDGKVNSVLATAITASDVKHGAEDKKR